MNLPTVSVVMSVYNHGAFVRYAIDSVLSQDGVDLQFVIVNDGSTDESAAILDDYAAADARIRIIHQENCGLTRALIRGCAEATGDFIARQDADDISLPSRFRSQINYMNQHDLAFASCFVSQVGPENERLGEVRIADEPETATSQLLKNHSGVPCHGSMMMRRSVYESVDGYRSPFYYAQDTDLWSRLVEKGKYGCVPQCLYLLRSSPESISGSRRDVQARFHRLGIEAAVRRRNGSSDTLILDQASALTESVVRQYPAAKVRQNRAMSLYMIGATLLRNGDAAGQRYLRMSIQENPLFCRAWMRYLISFAVTGRTDKDDGRHGTGQHTLLNQASPIKSPQDTSVVDLSRRPSPQIDVSVVMSVFRDASHLRNAMDSVLNQQGVSLEVIAVDDGSTDGSGLILDEYALRDNRVRVMHQANTGLTRALINGCAAARGEFIARQDADDVSMPERFALQVQLLRSSKETVLVSSFTEVAGPGGEVLMVHDRPIDSQVATDLLLNGVCGPPRTRQRDVSTKHLRVGRRIPSRVLFRSGLRSLVAAGGAREDLLPPTSAISV